MDCWEGRRGRGGGGEEEGRERGQERGGGREKGEGRGRRGGRESIKEWNMHAQYINLIHVCVCVCVCVCVRMCVSIHYSPVFADSTQIFCFL